MRYPILLAALIAAAVLSLAGCASEPTKIVTGSLRPAKPAAKAAPVQAKEQPSHAAATLTPEDAKRASCLQRHVQHQRGEAPWGATTLDAVRAADAYCQDVMGKQ